MMISIRKHVYMMNFFPMLFDFSSSCFHEEEGDRKFITCRHRKKAGQDVDEIIDVRSIK